MVVGGPVRTATHVPPGTRARHAQHLALLAEGYLQTDAGTVPDVASATFYATHALALEPDSVLSRRLLATCYMMAGTSLVFPFAPSSHGQGSVPMSAASREGALAATYLLRRGTKASFTDAASAQVYATACTVLGRFEEAQEALAWTAAHAVEMPTPPGLGRDPGAMYAAQVRTQLGHMAMKQARYAEAATYFVEARRYDPLHWGAYTGLCDLGMAPPAADAFADEEEPQPAQLAGALPKRARPDDAAPTRPVRRVTPRAAALRSGMARTNSVPPPRRDTSVPPVPSIPTRRQTSDTARGTLATSRSANQAAPPKTELRRGAPPAKPRVRAPGVAARTDSGLRRADVEPKREPLKSQGDPESERYTRHLLRDFGEAYRLVRLYRGREAIPLLDASVLPPGSMRAAHRRTASVHCLMGRAYHDVSEYSAAEKHFSLARIQEPYLLVHMDIYSLVLFQLHREVALSALAQDLLEIDPRAPVAHIAAGNTWALQHQHDAAYQCFIQATLVSPEYAYAYTLAGYEALELEQTARAVRLFRNARRCDKRHWNALAGLGQVYLREGKPALASEAYAEAFLINSSNPVLLDLLGYALEQGGDTDGALAVYQRAIRMNPKAAMTRLKKAQLLLRTVHTHLRDAPTEGGARHVAPALRRALLHRRAAVHAELLQVCALAPMEPQVHLLLARSYMRLGGGRFAAADAAADTTPPSSPESAQRARLPRQYTTEIAHHLATAVDLDPRCIREVHAMGEGTKLALHGGSGTAVAEDESHALYAPTSFFEESGSIDGDMLDPGLAYDSSAMHASHSFAYEPVRRA